MDSKEMLSPLVWALVDKLGGEVFIEEIDLLPDEKRILEVIPAGHELMLKAKEVGDDEDSESEGD